MEPGPFSSARNQARSAPGNAPLPGKRLHFAIAESGAPPRAGIPQRCQQNAGWVVCAIKCLELPLHAHRAFGLCPLDVVREKAKKEKAGFIITLHFLVAWRFAPTGSPRPVFCAGDDQVKDRVLDGATGLGIIGKAGGEVLFGGAAGCSGAGMGAQAVAAVERVGLVEATGFTDVDIGRVGCRTAEKALGEVGRGQGHAGGQWSVVGRRRVTPASVSNEGSRSLRDGRVIWMSMTSLATSGGTAVEPM